MLDSTLSLIVKTRDMKPNMNTDGPEVCCGNVGVAEVWQQAAQQDVQHVAHATWHDKHKKQTGHTNAVRTAGEKTGLDPDLLPSGQHPTRPLPQGPTRPHPQEGDVCVSCCNDHQGDGAGQPCLEASLEAPVCQLGPEGCVF